jgi:hypothetical protein
MIDMHIRHSALASMIVAVAAVTFTSGAAQSPQDPPAATQQEQPGAKQAEGYAWADACKSCHEDIYESWAKTKHSRTIDRLSAAEQAQECIVCHTTGGIGKLEIEGKFVNRGVQCEGCHGRAAAHVADPTSKVGLSKTPSAKTCETCHNAKSPHFRGFVYQGMSKLSHAVPKK